MSSPPPPPPPTDDLGLSCILTIAGVTVPAVVRNTTPRLARAFRTVLASNGTANPVMGHAPGNSGRSQFQTTFLLPYLSAVDLLNSCLSTTPFTTVIAEGDAGGASLANCLASDFQVGGNEGEDILAQVTFDSKSEPTWDPTASGTATGDFFKFSDVKSFVGVSGTEYDDIMRFAFRIQPQLAQFRGNSKTGLPKKQKFAYNGDVTLMCEYDKVGDGEGVVAVGVPLTTRDVVLTLEQVVASPPGKTLILTAQSAFYDEGPQFGGDIGTYITEIVTATANKNAYSIGGTAHV